jgi:hypothetical protein
MTQVHDAKANKGAIDEPVTGDASTASTTFDSFELLKEGAEEAPKSLSEQIQARTYALNWENLPVEERKEMGAWLQKNFDELRTDQGLQTDYVSDKALGDVYERGTWSNGTPLTDADKRMIERIADNWHHMTAGDHPSGLLTKQAIDVAATAKSVDTANGETYIQHEDGKIRVVRRTGGVVDWSPDGHYSIEVPGGIALKLSPDGTGYVETPSPTDPDGKKVRMNLRHRDGELATFGDQEGVFRIRIDERGVKFGVYGTEMELTADGQITASGGSTTVTGGPDGFVVSENGKSNKVWMEGDTLCWSDLDGSNKECETDSN